MKVLIVSNRNSYDNPFVPTLADGMSNHGVDITCSLDEFWHNWENYDIIHFQWPNLLLKGMHTIESLQLLLSKIKAAKIPTVITCHNLQPHYNTNALLNQVYKLLYENIDYFVHMGSYSLTIMQQQYPKAKHVIIPHHIYDSLYKGCTMPNRDEAVKHLHLDSKYRYVVCFGAFRDDEERVIAQSASDYLRPHGFKVLTPGLARWKWRKNIWITLKSYLSYRRIKKTYPELISNGKFVSDEELPYYYAASDIALIHRKKILNSGNVPMALMMGKVIVGPNTGNVGTWLKELKNPTFDPDNITTMPNAFDEALANMDKGTNNKNYAYLNLTTDIISQKYTSLYNSMLKV